MRHHRIRSALAAALAASLLQGCAALPIAALAAPLLSAGGDALVKTGTEYSADGTVHRTFPLPMEQVRWGVREAFVRAQITVTFDESSSEGDRIEAETSHRTVDVELLSLTPVLTSMQLVVKRNAFASDKATASLLLAETEKVLEPWLTPLRKDESPPS